MDAPPPRTLAPGARAAAHVVLVPAAVLGLVVLVLSALAAGALMANGVAMQATWLWPSLRWMILNQPGTVATWTAWLAMPAVATLLLVGLLHRRVLRVAWWRWTLLGGVTHAIALAAATALEWLPRIPPDAWAYAAVPGFVIGLIATGWVEGTIRLVARLSGYRRKGLEQRTRSAFGRGTKVSVRPS